MSRPWFAWYPADYAADTKFLTPMADLIYRRLLDEYWLNQGPLPLNYAAIARAIRVDVRVAKRYLQGELSPYWVANDALLFNKRMDAEIEISQEKHKDAVRRGKLGGLAKAKAKATAKALADHNHSHSNSGGIKSPSSNIRTQSYYHQGDADQKRPEHDYAQNCPFDEIVAAYHEHAPSLIRCEKQTLQLQRDILAIWRDRDIGCKTLAGWIKFFQTCEKSDWISGRAKNKRRPHTLREIVHPETYAKIYEGLYD